MKELFDLLRKKERKVLGITVLLLLASLVFYSFIGLGEKRRYFRLNESFSAGEKNIQDLKTSRDEKKLEWNRWKEASFDSKDLKNNYFYNKEDIIQDLRQDLEKVFRRNSIPSPGIKYNYNGLKAEKINNMTASFNIEGHYQLVRKFIYDLENFQKFLVIEKIDFSDINTNSGVLKIKLTVAGYYYEK